MKTLISALILPVALFSQTGASQQSTKQVGTGTVLRNTQDKANDTISTKDFGAKCDGSDDTTAIQSAFNSFSSASGNHTLLFPCTSTVSNVYVPGTASGIILRGPSSPISYNDTNGLGDALIAKNGAAGALLTIYAPEAHLQDFSVSCHSQSYVGIVFSGTIDGRGDVFQAKSCTGPGFLITPVVGSYAFGTYGTVVTPTAGTSTTLTSQLNSGSTSGATFTVASTSLQGVNLGTSPACSTVFVDWGKSTQEQIAVSGVVGNTVTISSTTLYTHTVGAAAQCSFNNNGMAFHRRIAFGNGHWGLDMIQGPNNNSLTDNEFMDFANTNGGILAGGSALGFSHGHSEGNSGPPIQLGDLNGGGTNGTNGRIVLASVIEPLLDLENTVNAIDDVCGQLNTIWYRDPTQITFEPAGATSCTAYTSSGVGDSAFGWSQNPQTGLGRLSVKNKNGLATLQPNDPTGLGGSVDAGLQFYDAGGTLLNGLQGNSSTTGALSTGKASTSYSNPQWEVNGGPFADSHKLTMGVRTDTGFGWLQALVNGTTPTKLLLNPQGGNVVTGPINYVTTECTGSGTPAAACPAASADNALIVVSDAPLVKGLILTLNTSHALQAGANTIRCICGGTDSGAVGLKSHYSILNNIANAYVSGVDATAPQIYWSANGKWFDMSQ